MTADNGRWHTRGRGIVRAVIGGYDGLTRLPR
jgi:hypothetical protein